MRPRDDRDALVLSGLLVVYGNLRSLILGDNPASSRLGLASGLLLTFAGPLWALRSARLDPANLGLGTTSPLRGAATGLVAGLATAGTAVALASHGVRALGVERHSPAAPDSLLALAPEQLIRRICFYLFFDTVLPEEVAFRGVLLALLRRHHAPLPAVALAALPFTLWHLVLAIHEMATFSPTKLGVKLGGYYAGGLIFGALRVWSGHLASSLVAHWVANASLMLAVHPIGQSALARLTRTRRHSGASRAAGGTNRRGADRLPC